MNLEMLHTELQSRNLALVLTSQGGIACTGQQGNLTAELVQALKDHKAALVSELTAAAPITEPGQLFTDELEEYIPAPVPSERPAWRPSPEALAMWEAYYGTCPWYAEKNIFHDNPVGLALEYATGQYTPACCALFSQSLISFYAECQPRPVNGEQVEPRVFTELLYTAYQGQQKEQVLALAAHFGLTDGRRRELEDIMQKWQPGPSSRSIPAQNGHRTGHTGQDNAAEAAADVPVIVQGGSLDKETDPAVNAVKPALPQENEMVGIGVLTADTLYTWKPGQQKIERQPVSLEALNLEALYQIGCQHRLHSLWLCPGSSCSLYFYEHPEAFVPEGLEAAYKVSVKRREKDKVPCSGSICTKAGPRGYRPFLRVYLPDHDSTWLEDLDDIDHSWSLSDVEDPMQFISTLVIIFQKLGVYLATSPAKTGIDSMQSHTNGREWAHTEQEVHLPKFAEIDIFWKRVLAASEQGLYLHKFDRNSMYLAATTGADMGIGTPEHREQEEAVRAFSDGFMGIWEVTVREPGQFSQETALFPHNEVWAGKQWITSPGLKSLAALGYDYEMHQGYVWFNEKGRSDIGKRRALKDWAKALWEVRKELKGKYGPDNPAYRLIKMIANRSLGWLDLISVRERIRKGCELQEVPWYYKPYYYQEIKGLARLRMVLKMQELGAAGHYPALVWNDGLFYLSPEKDGRQVFSELLTREGELGGFKYEGCWKVTPEIIELFSSDHAANDTLKNLKTIEKEAA